MIETDVFHKHVLTVLENANLKRWKTLPPPALEVRKRQRIHTRIDPRINQGEKDVDIFGLDTLTNCLYGLWIGLDQIQCASVKFLDRGMHINIPVHLVSDIKHGRQLIHHAVAKA